MDKPSKVVSAQDSGHGEGFNYVNGSPHLRHVRLRTMIEQQLASLVESTLAQKGECRVLEIGAGHGTFTQMLLDAGAEVTVTEASRASANALASKYAGRSDVTVHFDLTGESVFDLPAEFDGVVCASLLHHIPDYVNFVSRLSDLTTPGGWFYSAQDPLYYPRRSRITKAAFWSSYAFWRVGQGNVRQGLATRMRRLRGVYSDTEPSDLIEYHVVRQGVDELALENLLESRYKTVEVFTYWSTQLPLFQRLYENTKLHNQFGLIGRSRTR